MLDGLGVVAVCEFSCGFIEDSGNWPSAGSLVLNPPQSQPNSATGYGVAISTSSGTETIQGVVTGWTQYTIGQSISEFYLPCFGVLPENCV